MVAVPLVGRAGPIGVLSLVRFEVQPFSEREIALLETFADQAVIAIENARLFSELERRNAELQESNRQVSEALEQQTATAEVLEVIASSPTDLDVVLQSIVEAANRLCQGDSAVVYREAEGGLRLRAIAGYIKPAFREIMDDFVVPIDERSLSGRAALERRTIHEEDVLTIP